MANADDTMIQKVVITTESLGMMLKQYLRPYPPDDMEIVGVSPSSGGELTIYCRSKTFIPVAQWESPPERLNYATDSESKDEPTIYGIWNFVNERWLLSDNKTIYNTPYVNVAFAELRRLFDTKDYKWNVVIIGENGKPEPFAYIAPD